MFNCLWDGDIMKCSNVKSVKGEFMDVRKGQINTQIEEVEVSCCLAIIVTN